MNGAWLHCADDGERASPAARRNDVHRRPDSRRSDIAFVAVAALLFVASVAGTVAWGEAMSQMQGMEMPGGWTMSMVWMRMPGGSWLASAASFVGMWTLMMVAMMLPLLVPTFWRLRRDLREAGETRIVWLTALAAFGYFLAWALVGVAVYALGLAVAQLAMRQAAVSQVVPLLAGAAIVIAGLLQLSAWKVRVLACWQHAQFRGPVPARAGPALRHGLQLAGQCSACCVGAMTVLLVVGVMDLKAMAAVAAAITLERLVPARVAVARLIGVAAIVGGLMVIVDAALFA